jgi:hypothetical protein
MATYSSHKLIKGIKTRDDLVNFIKALKDDYDKEGSDWENRDLGRFLEALAAWTNSMDGYYKNHGMPIPETPSWKTIADMLIAATMQE